MRLHAMVCLAGVFKILKILIWTECQAFKQGNIDLNFPVKHSEVNFAELLRFVWRDNNPPSSGRGRRNTCDKRQ